MLRHSEIQSLESVFEIFTEFLHDVVVLFGPPQHLHFMARLSVRINAFKYAVHGFDTGAVDIDKCHFNFQFSRGSGGQLVDGCDHLTVKSRHILGKGFARHDEFQRVVGERNRWCSVGGFYLHVRSFAVNTLNGCCQDEVDTVVIDIDKGVTDGVGRPAGNLKQPKA